MGATESYHVMARIVSIRAAITRRDDDCATSPERRAVMSQRRERRFPRPRSGLGSRTPAAGTLLLAVAGLEEIDAHLVAIDPGEFAATIGESGR